MSTLATFNALVLSRVPDVDSIMDSDERDAAVLAGLETYNQHRKRTVVVDAAGENDAELALPAAWVADYSELKAVEYPVDNVPPTMLDHDTYEVYQKPASTVIMLHQHTPADTETVRLTITVPYEIDADSSTLPAAHEKALADLSAGHLCEWVSAHYSSAHDSTLAVDSADHQSQGREFAARAKRFRTLGLAALGISTNSRGQEDVVKPASATRSHQPGTLHGLWRLTH